MTDSLGLSIGTANLVAVRAGYPPVSRQAVLTLFDRRAPEVGVSDAEPGLMLRGFVQRVGDPVPLVAADGSAHRGEQLLAEALDALARTVGHGAPVAIAAPAHWGPDSIAALRAALAAKPGLTPGGTPAPLISDSAAAIAALYAQPGLPTDGVVALCDFGASGSSITLVDAASNFAPLAETVRYGDFSGDRIDQGLVSHVLAGVGGDADPANTLAVGSLTRLRGECQRAKERLSAEAATVIPVEAPGFAGDVQLTRAELENAISVPLAGFLAAVTDTLARHRIPSAKLTAVATVGGGASIPLITAQLSERLQVPVVTADHPVFSAAVGAGILAEQGPPAGSTTAAEAVDSPTSMAPAAWAAGAAEEARSATFRALAWSQEDAGADEPVPYTGEDYTVSGEDANNTDYADYTDYAEPEPLAWYQRPAVLFGFAAALALAAIGGLAYTLTGTSNPTENTAPPEEAPPPVVVTVTAPNGETSLSTIAPPSTTTTKPTTTESSPEPTTTTQPSTTTEATTTQAPPTTTQAPPSTSRAVPTTAAPTTQAPARTTGGS
jgi:cell division ATPase FtsA